MTGRCLDGRHLVAADGVRSELGVMGGCFEPAAWVQPRYVAPVECGSRMSRAAVRTTLTPIERPRPPLKRLTIALNASHPDPVVNVVIRGNCRRVGLDADAGSSADILEQARRCVRRVPHAGCGDAVCSYESGCATYTGQFIEISTRVPLTRQLGGAPGASTSKHHQTFSLLDAGFCEICYAPSSSHGAERITRLQTTRLVSGHPPLELYALEYLIEFEPRVAGPHLVYARVDYGNETVALSADGTVNMGWRGAFIGARAGDSPFALDVAANELHDVAAPTAPTRTCGLSDFEDLSDAAMIAADAEMLSLPRSHWVLTPRGCRIGRHRISCSDGEQPASRARHRGRHTCVRSRPFLQARPC